MYMVTSHSMVKYGKDLINLILHAFLSKSEIEIVDDNNIVIFKLFSGRVLESMVCFKCEDCVETKVEKGLQGVNSIVCVQCGSTIAKSAKDISKQIREKKNQQD